MSIVAEFDFEALERRSGAAAVAAATTPTPSWTCSPRRAPRPTAARGRARTRASRAGRAEALAALAPALAALDQAVEAMQLEQVARRRAARAPRGRARAARWPRRCWAARSPSSPSGSLEAVRGALRGIVERERVTVLVNPEDLEIVRDAMDDLRASLGGIEHCVVQAERRVGRGGCHRAHARGRRRRARRDQARAAARSSPPRSVARDPRALPIGPRCSRDGCALDAVGAR